MLDALFTSTARINLLKILLLDVNGRFYLRELAKKAGLQLLSVQRELANLTEAGILVKETSGRQTYYRINKNCPIISELRSIFVKTVGVADIVKAALSPLADRIELAFIYGSFAKATETTISDVDVMIVGDVTLKEIVSVLRPAQDELHREINPSVYSVDEFRNRIAHEDHFITSIIKEPRIPLLGGEHDLG